MRERERGGERERVEKEREREREREREEEEGLTCFEVFFSSSCVLLCFWRHTKVSGFIPSESLNPFAKWY